MVQNWVARLLLSPISLLYGFGISLRNGLYKSGIVRSSSFNIPVINVGNLTIGGAGKSPHIEWLAMLLKPYMRIAILSRGYKRKTKGFRFVNIRDNANQSGDEPLQFKRKYQDVVVAVSESRATGIPEIIKAHPETRVVLLDDAFQHLAVKPHLNILLTTYDNLFTNDYLMPSGRLREWRSAYERANIIIVSKCPNELDEAEKERITSEIKPLQNQKIFFSYYAYGEPYYLYGSSKRETLNQDHSVVLVSAIANTSYLHQYLDNKVGQIEPVSYEDHHYFSEHEMGQIKILYDNLASDNKIILTTEKDAIRMDLHRDFLQKNELPIYVLPVQVRFHFNQEEEINGLIKDFLLNFKI